MPEMPDAGEHHGDAGRVGGGDHLVVAHRAARLDHGRRARFDRRSSPSAKGKNASDATTEPLVAAPSARPPAALLGLARGDARGIDPAHLAGADADRRAVPGVDDGVRLDVLGDAEGEAQIGDLGSVGARFVTTFSSRSSTTRIVARLHQQPARDRCTVVPRRADRAGRRPPAGAGSSSPRRSPGPPASTRAR